MPDLSYPSPKPPPPASGPGGFWVAGLILGLIATALWIWTAVQAFGNDSDLKDIAEDSFIDASAVQISQLADQALVQIVPYVAMSLAVTVLAFVVIGLGLLRPASS